MSNCNFESRCDVASTPNDIKILLKEVRVYIKELMETTEATLLKHDKKLAELCVYLKNNLPNSIRCLLLDMKLSGELDKIISEVLNDNYHLITVSCSLYKDLKTLNGGVY